jgi:hypothetical protein
MIATYLVMKIALRAVVDECNRLAAEAETQAQAWALKSRVAALEMDLASGKISEGEYTAMAAKLLSGLNPLGGAVDREGVP